MVKKTDTLLELPVSFGNVSIGKKTARLSVSIDRSVLKLTKADDVFCGHRLSGRITVGAKDGLKQGKLIEDADDNAEDPHEINGVFDCTRIGANADEITTGLTFSKKDVDISELSMFSNGTGTLYVRDVGDIPEDAKEDSDEDADEPAISLKMTGPLRSVKLSALFGGSIRKALEESNLTTLGKLRIYIDKGYKLTDIAGIGAGKASNILERLAEFWKANPHYADGDQSGDGDSDE